MSDPTTSSAAESPSLSTSATKEIKLERLHIENDKLKDTWTSSCFGTTRTCSRSLIKYAMQCLFSLSVLIFSMYMITIAADAQAREVWISTLSCIIGLHVPNPSIDND